jgi:hypothetical protein
VSAFEAYRLDDIAIVQHRLDRGAACLAKERAPFVSSHSCLRPVRFRNVLFNRIPRGKAARRDQRLVFAASFLSANLLTPHEGVGNSTR